MAVLALGAAALVVTAPWALRLRPGGRFVASLEGSPTKGSNDLLHSMTTLILPLLRLVCLPKVSRIGFGSHHSTPVNVVGSSYMKRTTR